MFTIEINIVMLQMVYVSDDQNTIVYAVWRKTQKYIKWDFIDVFVAI